MNNKTIKLKQNVTKLVFGLLFVSIASVIGAKNHNKLCIYYEYFNYKTSSGNNDAIASMYRIIDYATEAGYICENKQSPGVYAHQEITKRKKYFSASNQYKIGYCVQLPTGQILLTINNSIGRSYVLLEVDAHNPKFYRILDIRGEALG
jgi:hypothetical protein